MKREFSSGRGVDSIREGPQLQMESRELGFRDTSVPLMAKS